MVLFRFGSSLSLGFSDTLRDFSVVHDLPGKPYRGLLGTWPPELMPPETMTRQRRRAQERADRKRQRAKPPA